MINDDYFYQTDNIPDIDPQHMKDLLENPPMLCGDEDCPRDDVNKYCRCITSVFMHETHYEHYLALVKMKIENAFVDLITNDNNLASK